MAIIMGKFQPRLGDSQLSFRINLARKRLASYPLDNLDFIFVNLERPETSINLSYWCTGDLTGRIIEALAVTEGMTGEYDERLKPMFYRALRMKQPDGLIGRYAQCPEPRKHEDLATSGSDKMFTALLQYYFYTGDYKALEAAKDIGAYLIRHKDFWMEELFHEGRSPGNQVWLTEPFAMLYHATGDEKYAALLKECLEKLKKMKAEGCHTHGFLTALRGFQRMAVYTGDKTWNELPEYYRRKIIENHWQNALGDVCESLPFSRRNEACAASDWLMMNLWSAYINDDDAAYAEAEHIFYNAVFFNQIITGGSGHRSMEPWGYSTKEFQEAWWCCTETSLLGMSEFAKHAVTFKDGKVRVNFLVPGKYTHKDITVNISTLWPAKADTVITVEGCDNIYVRMPKDVKNGKEERTLRGTVTAIRLSGDIGHTVEPWNDGLFVLKYGPLVLAPLTYRWKSAERVLENEIPRGYEIPDFPSVSFTVTLPETDQNGFYRFAHLPYPEWPLFDEGAESRTAFDGVSINVVIHFKDGTAKTVRFNPVCYNISALTFYEIPVMFRLKP